MSEREPVAPGGEKRIGDLTREQWEVWASAQASVIRIEEINRHVKRLLALIAAAFSSAPSGDAAGQELREAALAARGTIEAFRAYYIYDNRLGGKEHTNAEVRRADKTLDLLERALSAPTTGRTSQEEK